MEVIALRGKHDSGKSETLRIVYQMLRANGYTQVPGHFISYSADNDLYDLLTNGKQIVGIVSRGDVGT